jgi:hypothetical protein
MPLTFVSLVFTASLVAKLPLVVRTYDAVGLSPGTLEQMQASTNATLAAVGIRPIWRPCHVVGCIARPKLHEIEIRIVKATTQSQRDALGYAAVDVVQRGGVLGTVFVDRVDALATTSGVDRVELLGRAVAHEIGHLLLGTVEHSPFGLMRATWTTAELRRSLPLDWVFSRKQGAEMRRRLSAPPEAAYDTTVDSVSVDRFSEPLGGEEQCGHDGVGERERPRGREPQDSVVRRPLI